MLSNAKHLEPAKGDRSPAERRRRARRTTGTGFLIGAIALVMMFAPLAIPLGALAKYLVAFGLFCGIWGASCVLHGAWDWWRGR